MTGRPADAVGAGVAFVGTVVAVLMSGAIVPAWPSAPPTIAGLWLIDAVSAIPVGDPMIRAAAASASLAAMTAALAAWTLARLGHGLVVAAGATLAIGLVSYGRLVSSADLPASLAAALATAATAVSLTSDRPPVARASLSAALLLGAGGLQPAAYAVLPLVVIHTVEGSTAARVLAGAFGVLTGAWWSGDGLTGTADAMTRLNALGQPWLWPAAIAMLSGTLAPLWGRPAATTAVVGTAMMVAFNVVGHQAVALTVFPTMLLAVGVESLPTPTSRARGMLAIALLAISAGEAWRRPVPDTWRLLAWRDAVERSVPAGTRIITGNTAAAALGGPLFRGRPSRLAVVLDMRGAEVDDGETRYLLEDRAAPVPSKGQLSHVPVSYADVADLVARLPERSIVGVAIAVSDPDVGRDAARAVLTRLGHRNTSAAAHVAAVGIVGKAPAAGLVHDDGGLHVLIGDPLGADGQRSPTDFELRSAADGVSVSLRGRVLATGRRWVVIAIRPGGPLIEAMADADGQTPWAIRVPGLQVWRESP